MAIWGHHGEWRRIVKSEMGKRKNKCRKGGFICLNPKWKKKGV
jgi:hypothetical protein